MFLFRKHLFEINVHSQYINILGQILLVKSLLNHFKSSQHNYHSLNKLLFATNPAKTWVVILSCCKGAKNEGTPHFRRASFNEASLCIAMFSEIFSKTA